MTDVSPQNSDQNQEHIKICPLNVKKFVIVWSVLYDDAISSYEVIDLRIKGSAGSR